MMSSKSGYSAKAPVHIWVVIINGEYKLLAGSGQVSASLERSKALGRIEESLNQTENAAFGGFQLRENAYAFAACRLVEVGSHPGEGRSVEQPAGMGRSNNSLSRSGTHPEQPQGNQRGASTEGDGSVSQDREFTPPAQNKSHTPLLAQPLTADQSKNNAWRNTTGDNRPAPKFMHVVEIGAPQAKLLPTIQEALEVEYRADIESLVRELYLEGDVEGKVSQFMPSWIARIAMRMEKNNSLVRQLVFRKSEKNTERPSEGMSFFGRVLRGLYGRQPEVDAGGESLMSNQARGKPIDSNSVVQSGGTVALAQDSAYANLPSLVANSEDKGVKEGSEGKDVGIGKGFVSTSSARGLVGCFFVAALAGAFFGALLGCLAVLFFMRYV